MILEEETYKRFGYYPSDLSPKSGKRILAACDDCGRIRELRKIDYSALCHSCTIKGKRHPRWKGGKTKSVCLICGKEFDVAPSQIKNGRGKYCSQECMGIALSKNWQSTNNPRWKGGPVERKCLECGRTFHTNFFAIKRGGGKYCSRACMGIAYSKNRIGEKSSNWKNGASFEPYCFKFNEKFKQYIRAKFGNVCFLCKKTEEANGQRLSIHHVNYDKGCGCAETEEDKKVDDGTCQFVPLCVSCNSKVNKDRDKWEKYFKNKLRNKLNGWYI